MTKTCAVCGKIVATKDQADHLRSDHLGPHYFRLNGRPYRTMYPSMRCMELLQHLELPMHGYIWEIRDGKEIDYNHVSAIDLTRQPQLFFELDAEPKRLQDPRGLIERCPEMPCALQPDTVTEEMVKACCKSLALDGLNYFIDTAIKNALTAALAARRET